MAAAMASINTYFKLLEGHKSDLVSDDKNMIIPAIEAVAICRYSEKVTMSRRTASMEWTRNTVLPLCGGVSRECSTPATLLAVRQREDIIYE